MALLIALPYIPFCMEKKADDCMPANQDGIYYCHRCPRMTDDAFSRGVYQLFSYSRK